VRASCLAGLIAAALCGSSSAAVLEVRANGSPVPAIPALPASLQTSIALAASFAPEAKVRVFPEDYRIAGWSAPGASPLLRARVQGLLDHAVTVRYALDRWPGSRASAEEMTQAADSFDALLRAADGVGRLKRVWVYEEHPEAVPFGVPLPRFYAQELRQAPRLLQELSGRPREPGLAGRVVGLLSPGPDRHFWRRLRALGHPVPRQAPRRVEWLQARVQAAVERAPSAQAPADREKLLGEIAYAEKTADAVGSRMPFDGPQAGKAAMRALAFAFVELALRSEDALRSPDLLPRHRAALRRLIELYDLRARESADSVILRYAHSQFLAGVFWGEVERRVRVPYEKSGRRAWMQTILDRLD
jgi:hypothetical protein